MCIFCSNFAADFNMREYALAVGLSHALAVLPIKE